MKTIYKTFLIFLFASLIQEPLFSKQAEKEEKQNHESNEKETKKEKTQKNKEKSEKKTSPLSVKKISEDMSVHWCKKLEECAPDSGMKKQECQRVLEKSFAEGFERIASGHEVSVSQKQLEQCIHSLSESSCEGLKNSQNLKGCEFITYLNRQ